MSDQQHMSLHFFGLKCDHCDWKDVTIPFENYGDWLNKKCPKCGQNVLTEEDYKSAQLLNIHTKMINSLTSEELEVLNPDSNVKASEYFSDVKGSEFIDQGPTIAIIDAHKGLRIKEFKKA